MQTYQVEISLSKQADRLWRAEAPLLPGCFVDAKTPEAAIADIQEAIQLFVASYRKHGDPLPRGLSAIAESESPQHNHPTPSHQGSPAGHTEQDPQGFGH